MAKKILLADDSITIQKVVRITLADGDYELFTVDNGDDAVVKAGEILPDLILADVLMPGKNGYQVCEAVKSDPRLRHVPVLLLAGTFEGFDEMKGAQIGADGYIIKPFESVTLISKVEEILSRKPAVPVTDVTIPAAPPPPEIRPSAPEIRPPAPPEPPSSPVDDLSAAPEAAPASSEVFAAESSPATDADLFAAPEVVPQEVPAQDLFAAPEVQTTAGEDLFADQEPAAAPEPAEPPPPPAPQAQAPRDEDLWAQATFGAPPVEPPTPAADDLWGTPTAPAEIEPDLWGVTPPPPEAPAEPAADLWGQTPAVEPEPAPISAAEAEALWAEPEAAPPPPPPGEPWMEMLGPETATPPAGEPFSEAPLSAAAEPETSLFQEIPSAPTSEIMPGLEPTMTPEPPYAAEIQGMEIPVEPSGGGMELLTPAEALTEADLGPAPVEPVSGPTYEPSVMEPIYEPSALEPSPVEPIGVEPTAAPSAEPLLEPAVVPEAESSAAPLLEMPAEPPAEELFPETSAEITAPAPPQPADIFQAEPEAAPPLVTPAEPPPSYEPSVPDLGPAVEAAAQRISAAAAGVSKEELSALIREVVESVVWEVVPALAEAMIEERILQMEQAKAS